ncbi:hypothetical protein J2W23_000231 [Variovorax boronicumulans]|uniref:hypothetical protein n=1 Tax=Variovorax boronicumulans TaxID=436515 RepID=UPI0027851B56|nr:hypothetical protein [Variovorax boronicumulans]MDQ0011867.1 hypothetical protein [Variovorax boronicumulans]
MFAALALGFAIGMFFAALIWLDGERAERNYRIQCARRRDHSKVPAIRWRAQ